MGVCFNEERDRFPLEDGRPDFKSVLLILKSVRFDVKMVSIAIYFLE